MDLTNVRSMEFFRKLGLAEGLRERGVPSHIPYTVLISSGLSQDSAITQWNHPSVDEYRQMIAGRNDGTMPLEPWQRISQEIFEAWLKQLSETNDLIDLRFGWKLETVHETEQGVEATVTDLSRSKTDTFTTHLFLPMDADESAIGTEEAVYRVLGGMYQPYEVQIDQVMGWIYLAGDSAHQNIPTGGYGMNMGLGDAYDIGWKLAGVMQGWAGKGVLQSYEEERRPVALTNVERSGVHMAVHAAVPDILKGFANELDASTDKGRQLRQKIHQHYQANDGENTDRGIEMGYRYKSAITIPDTTTKEPDWTPHEYVPTTWPGSRPPHVFLKDGKTAIFDLLGKYFTLVHFISGDTDKAGHAEYFHEAAKTMAIPFEHITLRNEDHARALWERNLVLVRPDGHVSWRADVISHRSTAFHVLEVATGYHYDAAGETIAQQKADINGKMEIEPGKDQPREFTLVGEAKSQDSEYQLDKMGEFQK
ncbi:FAD binding domain-containing protein [Cladophialophora immunda]|nr:FAD binding domain-containing protein [Cladophialophora immunda]